MPTPFPFVANSVLTAAQLNSISELPTRTLTGSGAAVAADAYSRVILNGTSITYTVNTSTFTTSQIVQLYNANSTTATIAAGAGITLNGAAGLTLEQYQSAELYAVSATSFILFKAEKRPGLELIIAGSFSGVASWTVDNVFSSTYRNYRVIVHNDQTTGAAAQVISTRLRVGGVESATTYYSARSGYTYTSTVAADVVNNGTYWFIQRSNGSGSSDGEGACVFDVYSPALAVNTFFNGTQSDPSYAGSCGGYHATATAYDGIGFGTTIGGTTMTGTYRIYGYRD